MLRIVATSDLHGHLPGIPECDLLVVAGDICPLNNHSYEYQKRFLIGKFSDWVKEVPARKVVSVWGNHDLWPQMESDERQLALDLAVPVVGGVPAGKWDILTDRLIEWEGLRIYGIPWSRDFFPDRWSFNLPEHLAAVKCEAIPFCDILVSHGPPDGYGDINVGGENCGFKCLREAVHRVEPAYAFCGHIHECGGKEYPVGIGEHPRVHNVSYVDVKYRPRKDAIKVIEWSKNVRSPDNR